ncbi:MAG: hypothetical protein DBY18_04125 [Clostridia bacterium]|nr:MAG: hypothetical protein DBY18_04125 [Clostridia bacterium]
MILRRIPPGRRRHRAGRCRGRSRAAGRPGAAGASGRSPLRRCGAPPGLRPYPRSLLPFR